MEVKILYSDVAIFDLRNIYEYIKRDSLFYAKREVSLIRASVKKLERNIFIGIKFEKLNNELIRELIFKNYLIIYEIKQDQKTIEILTIHHHARLLSNNRAFFDDDE